MRLIPLLLCFVSVAVTGGCGSGGSGAAPGNGSGGGSAAGTGRLSVFVTDAFSDEYAQVWVKIHRVELLDASGAAEAVFDDPAGVPLNLKALRDAAGPRYALMTRGTARSRPHTGVRVTLAPTVVLFPPGAAAGQPTPVADGVARDAAGRPVVEFPLAGGPRNLGAGDDDLAIDFDLPAFLLVDGKVRPAVREGDRAGLRDAGRQESREFTGAVTGLSGVAPDLAFTLDRPNGQSLTVRTGAATRVFHSGGSPSPALRNGDRVEVRGAFDAAADVLLASAVKIEDGVGREDEDEVEGAASAVDPATGRFVLTTVRVEGFLPERAAVAVVTTGGTVFRSDRGVLITAAEFYGALAAAGGAARAEAEGVYDAPSNTLTARKVKLESAGGGHGGDDNGGLNRAEARGRPADVDAAAGTFRLRPLDEWEGFLPAGAGLTVKTSAATRFRDADGRDVSGATFYAALPAAARVSAEGAYDASAQVLAATQARIRGGNSGSGGGDD